jgi:AcrR family transcriptional regulator
MSAAWSDPSLDRSGAAEVTRLRLLDATVDALSRLGAKKLSMSAVAMVAGVSRPTLYRYFPCKEELLIALADHQQRSFDSGLAEAIRSVRREEQLDAVLRFIVRFQADDGTRRLVDIEPTFVLDRLTRMLPMQRASLARLLADTLDHGADARPTWQPDDVADLIVRTAVSYFLIPVGDETQLLRALRAVVKIASDGPAPT